MCCTVSISISDARDAEKENVNEKETEKAFSNEIEAKPLHNLQLIIFVSLPIR